MGELGGFSPLKSGKKWHKMGIFRPFSLHNFLFVLLMEVQNCKKYVTFENSRRGLFFIFRTIEPGPTNGVAHPHPLPPFSNPLFIHFRFFILQFPLACAIIYSGKEARTWQHRLSHSLRGTSYTPSAGTSSRPLSQNPYHPLCAGLPGNAST